MATSKNNSRRKNSGDRHNATRTRCAEPALSAPDTERGLTHSPYFNGLLYKRMSEDLHLGGMSKRTHEGYLRAVRQLADFCKRSHPIRSRRISFGSSSCISGTTGNSPADHCELPTAASNSSTLAPVSGTGRHSHRCGSKMLNHCLKC